VRMHEGLVWRNTFFRDRAEAIETATAEANALASASG